MHQTRQRRFCRLVFLVGCILPTIAVLAWAAHEKWPSTKAGRLAAIERASGMRAEASRLFTPLSGVYRAEELRLSNIETDDLVLSAETATLDQRQSIPRIRMEGVKLSPGGLPLLAELVERTLEVDWPQQIAIELVKPQWLDNAASTKELLADDNFFAVLGGESDTHGRQCKIQIGENGPTLHVVRNRQVSPPATRLTLDTADKQVPARWLADLGAVVVDGGDQARFVGTAMITMSEAGVEGVLSGELKQVSLSDALQLPIDTMATIQHLKVTWIDRRIESAEGLIEAKDGTMDGSLARTLQYIYHTPQIGSEVAEDDSLEFGKLKAWFVLDKQALRFAGAIENSPQSPACVVDRDGEVLFGYPSSVMPVRDVATVLSYHGTAEAEEVATALPIPLKR